jgi:hypothetical protein
MPATFPAHSAAVLPIKMRWPYAFDGVALVIGSTAPDQAYALFGWFPIPAAHQWNGLFWFALPMALIEVWLCRRAAPIVAAHIAALRRPAWLARVVDVFAIGDYGALGARRHRWWVIVYSALLCGVTHLAWDGLAHRPGGRGVANDLLPFLRTRSIEAWGWWTYGETVSSIIGGIIALLLFARIGRRHMVRDWDGPAPSVRLRPNLFWSIAIPFVALDVLTWPIQDYKRTQVVQGERLLWAICLGLLFAAAAVGSRNRRSLPGDDADRYREHDRVVEEADDAVHHHVPAEPVALHLDVRRGE